MLSMLVLTAAPADAVLLPVLVIALMLALRAELTPAVDLSHLEDVFIVTGQK